MYIRIDVPEYLTMEATQDLAQTILSVASGMVPGSLVSIQDAGAATDGMAEEWQWQTRDRA